MTIALSLGLLVVCVMCVFHYSMAFVELRGVRMRPSFPTVAVRYNHCIQKRQAHLNVAASGMDPASEEELKKVVTSDGKTLEDLIKEKQTETTFSEKDFDVDTLTDDDAFRHLKKLLRGTCIYLIGMMGTGKSTVGNVLARKLDGYRLMDTDEIAEYMIEMPISDFFKQSEENVPKFRDLERQILQELAQYTRVVVSTGGGIVERNENWSFLRHGIVVFYDMSTQDIFDRLKAIPGQIEKRPLLQGGQGDAKHNLDDLLSKRIDKYSQADVTVKIQLQNSPDEVAAMTAKEILRFIKNNPPLWETWRKKRDMEALEAAGYANPKAAAESAGFGAEKKGSIQYVSMQDIKSGKVKLPPGTVIPNLDDQKGNEDTKSTPPPPPSKGFKK